MSRSHRLLAIALSTALLVGACSDRVTYEDRVIDILEVTRNQATAFRYVDERADRTVEVQGVIEDDFRVKAAVNIDGAPAYEQIAYDDTLAIRFLDPAKLRTVLSPAAAEADLETDLDNATSLDVLRSGRWLVDTTAAPLVSAASTQLEDLGLDPVLDAIGALAYIEQAAIDSVAVELWSEDSIDPTYSSSEDTFPVPESGSGVDRYDLRRPDLPALSENTGDSGGIALPNVRHFRKMAIYVKDGRVIQVLERVEATGKKLEQFIDYTLDALETFNFDKTYIDEFEVEVARSANDEDLADVLFAVFNTALVSIGQEPIVRRNMTLSFPDTAVDPLALPAENVVNGSLDALVASAAGQKALAAQNEEGREANLTGDTDEVIVTCEPDTDESGEPTECPPAGDGGAPDPDSSGTPETVPAE